METSGREKETEGAGGRETRERVWDEGRGGNPKHGAKSVMLGGGGGETAILATRERSERAPWSCWVWWSNPKFERLKYYLLRRAKLVNPSLFSQIRQNSDKIFSLVRFLSFQVFQWLYATVTCVVVAVVARVNVQVCVKPVRDYTIESTNRIRTSVIGPWWTNSQSDTLKEQNECRTTECDIWNSEKCQHNNVCVVNRGCDIRWTDDALKIELLTEIFRETNSFTGERQSSRELRAPEEGCPQREE